MLKRKDQKNKRKKEHNIKGSKALLIPDGYWTGQEKASVVPAKSRARHHQFRFFSGNKSEAKRFSSTFFFSITHIRIDEGYRVEFARREVSSKATP